MNKIRISVPPAFKDLLPAYLESRKQDLKALKDALTRKDFMFLSTRGHKTRGSAAGYGFVGLGEIAKKLEMAAISENIDASREAVAEMEKYLDQVEIAD